MTPALPEFSTGMSDVVAGKKRVPAWYFWSLVAIVLLGLALRGYRLTGWIMDNDETHFLIYAYHPSSLFVTDALTHARPDGFYALLCIPSIHLLGMNELGMKIWPVLFGTLSIVAMAALVWQYTHSRRNALWAAGLLAVFPLHVNLSTKAMPDVISVFFLICALIQLIHLSRPGAQRVEFHLARRRHGAGGFDQTDGTLPVVFHLGHAPVGHRGQTKSPMGVSLAVAGALTRYQHDHCRQMEQ